MKSFMVALSSLFLFPLSIMPDAVQNCADSSYVFNIKESTDADIQAASVQATTFAKSEFCRVVDRQIELSL